MKLELVFDKGSINSREFFRRCCGLLSGPVLERRDWFLNARPIKTFPKMEMASRVSTNFELECPELVVSFCPIGRYDLELLIVHGTAIHASDCEEWAAALSSEPGFVMGWVADERFDFWQNAQDLLEYEVEGRSPAGLPLVSNGLPYPLERMVVDTSKNPGRREFRDGYIEAVGATMWLGDRFWDTTGANADEVRGTPWLSIEKIGAGVLRVQAWPTPFDSAEGRQGQLQRDLRRLLFPGSATK